MKRWLSLVLVALFSLALISGCSNAENGNTDNHIENHSTENKKPAENNISPEPDSTTPPKTDTPCTSHSFGDWKVVTAATCTAAGVEIRICQNCDEFESREIAAVDHTFIGTAATEPTCETEGITGRIVCEICGLVSQDATPIPAPGHSYGDWTTEKEPTCGAAGTKTRACSTCGQEETAELSPLSQTYGSWTTTKEPACTADGEKTRTCSTCGSKETETITNDNAGHHYGEWTITKEPTCTATGEQIRICSNCGNKETEIIATADHIFDEWYVVESATCFLPGQEMHTCYTCGYSELRPTEPAGAEWHSMDEVERVEPTCEEDGYVVRLCIYCWEEERETLKATGKHDYDYAAGCCKFCKKDLDATKCLTFRLEGDGAYYVCTGLDCIHSHHELVIPSTYNGKPVKSITGDSLSFLWSYVRVIVIQEGIEELVGSVFFGQSSLREVYLPSSLNYIGKWVFGYCDNLEYVRIPTSGWSKHPYIGSSKSVDFSDPYTAAEILRNADAHDRFQR